MAAPTYWTAEMVRALPEDGNRYEVVHGELLVTPAPRLWHQEITGRLYLALRDYLEHERCGHALLAIEVLNPSSTRADRFTKRRWYQEAGVPLYWMVDGDAHAVEVWTPEVHFPTVERERITWHPAGANTAFVLELSELFKPI